MLSVVFIVSVLLTICATQAQDPLVLASIEAQGNETKKHDIFSFGNGGPPMTSIIQPLEDKDLVKLDSQIQSDDTGEVQSSTDIQREREALDRETQELKERQSKHEALRTAFDSKKEKEEKEMSDAKKLMEDAQKQLEKIKKELEKNRTDLFTEDERLEQEMKDLDAKLQDLEKEEGTLQEDEDNLDKEKMNLAELTKGNEELIKKLKIMTDGLKEYENGLSSNIGDCEEPPEEWKKMMDDEGNIYTRICYEKTVQSKA